MKTCSADQPVAPMVTADGKARRWIDSALDCFFCFASYKLITSRT
ncbi:hypothetical protein [Nisaea denitrificans]|nr:hypothetical protein [Nisaea denitrificans]